MIGLTNTQQQIQTSLITAISNNNLKTVQDIFNNDEYDDVQAALRHEGTLTSDKGTILDFVINCSKASVNTKAEIIELIWQEADQKTRDFLCGYKVANGFEDQPYFTDTIDNLKRFQGKIDSNNTDIYSALETVIQEMEEHKRVMGLGSNLQEAIISLDVNQVKAALENCGEDAARVLERRVYWNSGNVDVLLVCPLTVKYSKELNQEDVKKIKEIFELMLGYAPPWLHRYEVQCEGSGENYVMNRLVLAQERFATVPGVGEEYFQDLIDKFAQELNEDTIWSKHKGKIALGVTGLCVAGAVAAYVLAYPAVALALAVLAAVILMGAGIAKVLEDPSVERTFTEVQR